MSATSLLFILIGVFIIINANNLVQVVQGKAQFSFVGTGKRTDGHSVGGSWDD